MNDGGPAFPRNGGAHSSHQGSWWALPQDGMSLRDYFAAHFMDRAQSLCTDRDGGWNIDAAAHIAYEMADAMLAAREGEPPAAQEGK